MLEELPGKGKTTYTESGIVYEGCLHRDLPNKPLNYNDELLRENSLCPKQ